MSAARAEMEIIEVSDDCEIATEADRIYLVRQCLDDKNWIDDEV